MSTEEILDDILDAGQVSTVLAIRILMGREAARRVIKTMIVDGRTTLTEEEERELNEESEAIRARRDEAIARARAEGR